MADNTIPVSGDPGSWLGRLVVKIFGPANAGWITRGVAGAIYAIFIGFGPIFLSGAADEWIWPALFYAIYPIYIFLNFTVGGLLSYFKVKDYIIEPAIGAAVAMLVIFI